MEERKEETSRTPVPSLARRVECLEQEIRDAADQITSIRNAFAEELNELRRELRFVRTRLAAIHPEQVHCPKCHQLVHPRATSCKCGHRWGKQEDPNTGLPT